MILNETEYVILEKALAKREAKEPEDTILTETEELVMEKWHEGLKKKCRERWKNNIGRHRTLITEEV